MQHGCRVVLAGLLGCGADPSKVQDSGTAGEVALRVDCDEQVDGFIGVSTGTFLMGSPMTEVGREDDEAARVVTLTRPFLIGQTEVTRADFRAVMGYTVGGFPDCGDDCPIEEVTWYEAAVYANALSEADGLAPCYQCNGEDAEWACTGPDEVYSCEGWRLPMEAEWEYAARAESTGSFPSGGSNPDSHRDGDCTSDYVLDDGETLTDYGWYCGNSAQMTHPVGQLLPNAWGLHGVVGNVREWVHDGYEERIDGAGVEVVDPIGDPDSAARVRRGGSWYSRPQDARLAYRSIAGPGDRYEVVGFRVARTCSAGL